MAFAELLYEPWKSISPERNTKLWPRLGQRDVLTTADKPLWNTEV